MFPPALAYSDKSKYPSESKNDDICLDSISTTPICDLTVSSRIK